MNTVKPTWHETRFWQPIFLGVAITGIGLPIFHLQEFWLSIGVGLVLAGLMVMVPNNPMSVVRFGIGCALGVVVGILLTVYVARTWGGDRIYLSALELHSSIRKDLNERLCDNVVQRWESEQLLWPDMDAIDALVHRDVWLQAVQEGCLTQEEWDVGVALWEEAIRGNPLGYTELPREEIARRLTNNEITIRWDSILTEDAP